VQVQRRLAATERARSRLLQQRLLWFGAQLPNHTIVLLLALVFCCISPAVLAPCCLYFLLALLVERYQVIYVFAHREQTGGQMWRQVRGPCWRRRCMQAWSSW
jgi:hypothetical protein